MISKQNCKESKAGEKEELNLLSLDTLCVLEEEDGFSHHEGRRYGLVGLGWDGNSEMKM